jgi:hypothetical protein
MADFLLSMDLNIPTKEQEKEAANREFEEECFNESKIIMATHQWW